MTLIITSSKLLLLLSVLLSSLSNTVTLARRLEANHTDLLYPSHYNFTRDGGLEHVISGQNFQRQLTVVNTNSISGENEEVFDVGVPHYGGNGCPGYSVEVAPEWASDSGVISILFSQYEAYTEFRQTRDRKSCNLALPIQVKPGISVGIFKVDYRGYAFIPKGRNNYAKFDAEYFFAGRQGPKQRRIYGRDGLFGQDNGHDWDDSFFASDQIGAIVWTGCNTGTDFNFRINTALAARKQRGNLDDVEIVMDSVDIVEEGFHYYIRLRHC